ncbi:MAG: peroxiredoxin [Novosphingobium sp.]|nr:peroxiredoxin [Novosphingobium sp.]
MKCILAAASAILAIVTASPAAAALAVGNPAPDFSAPGAQAGTITTVHLAELLKKGPVVIYFFPSAFTDPAESHDFAAEIDKFRAAGASVIGMSRDSVDTLARFSLQECAGKYPVASASESIVNAFDVNDGAMFNTRTTYVIAPSGKIAFVHDDDDSSGHASSALAFVEAMTK